MRWYITLVRELGDQMATLAGRQGQRRDSSFTGPHSPGLRAGNPVFYDSAKVKFSRDMAGTRAKEKPGPWIAPIYLLVGTRCLAEVRHNPQSKGTAEFCHFSQTHFFKASLGLSVPTGCPPDYQQGTWLLPNPGI